MTLPLPASWLAQLAQRVDVAPRAPRVALLAGDARIGSVEPELLSGLQLPASVVREQAGAWQVQADLQTSLDAIATAMRDAGIAHSWRNEQLAVTDEAGRRLATIERAAVRPLGITTFAVHLAGMTREGRHWVQQRALTKATDPGLWDTLMGGMVPASDSLEAALERETWEEAGLRMSQLERLSHAGRVLTRRPSVDYAGGFIVEWLDWYRCVVPAGIEPRNQDGEVERFALLDDAELARRLLGEDFTLEAAWVLSESAR
ncbi:MAG TPA: NUDIX domain-containing protein [Ramlibacter sp.]|nr:NUDIX domain-containing protein [Ramlibacter sp.]